MFNRFLTFQCHPCLSYDQALVGSHLSQEQWDSLKKYFPEAVRCCNFCISTTDPITHSVFSFSKDIVHSLGLAVIAVTADPEHTGTPFIFWKVTSRSYLVGTICHDIVCP
jgi:hypothetical protein